MKFNTFFFSFSKYSSISFINPESKREVPKTFSSKGNLSFIEFSIYFNKFIYLFLNDVITLSKVLSINSLLSNA